MLNLIDTRVGTANSHSYSNGNTLAYTGVPFGMNYFVPQTAHDRGSWFFHPQDRIFQGFRLTHQPSPWMSDFSHFLITPVAQEKNMKDQGVYFYQSSYRPEEAVFQPHYLKVKQQRYGITSELVPSTYGAVLRLNYPKNEARGLYFYSAGPSSLTLDKENGLMKGYISNFQHCEDENFKMYVALKFDGEILNEETVFEGNDQTILLKLDVADKTEIKLATSFISLDQAELNLSRGLSFEETKQAAAEKWENYLSKIEVNSANQEQVKTFYNCMYRAFLFPQKFYELDNAGNPIHYDTKSKEVKSGFLYTNNGFWDTFRTVYPLYSLLIPDEYEEMLEGFLNSYRYTGFLPKWLSPDERGLMPGTLIDGLIADAAVKNIGSHLMEELLEGMLAAAKNQSENANYGRQGTNDYLKYGYVPLDFHESCNHTQDYAYSDFCISQVAKVLGKESLSAEYATQSLNYKNIFDKETGFMRAKDKDGNFRPDFSPTSWGLDYAEGSAWQNSFAVYHDFKGLIEEHGGKDAFLSKLTELCNTAPSFDVKGYGYEIHEMSEMAAVDFGQLALSNQPSFHIPYLFNYVGQPASSQVLLKQLMTNLFDTSFTGFPGDEDNGSMSAWFIFSTMGFYPVTAGSGEYVLGIPLFDEVKIHLPQGKEFVIMTKQNAPQANFVQNTVLNEKSWEKLFIQHKDIVHGGNLDFTLGIVPAIKSYNEEDLPYSLTK